MLNFYELLGVPEDAQDADIASAYRRAMRAAHPDAGGSASIAAQLNIAYETLSSPSRRREYDASIRPPEPAISSAKPSADTPTGPRGFVYEPGRARAQPTKRTPGSRVRPAELGAEPPSTSLLDAALIGVTALMMLGVLVGGLEQASALGGVAWLTLVLTVLSMVVLALGAWRLALASALFAALTALTFLSAESSSPALWLVVAVFWAQAGGLLGMLCVSRRRRLVAERAYWEVRDLFYSQPSTTAWWVLQSVRHGPTSEILAEPLAGGSARRLRVRGHTPDAVWVVLGDDEVLGYTTRPL